MNRTDALNHLNDGYSPLAIALGSPTTDAAPGWKHAIDSAFRTLGVARADLATPSSGVADEAKTEALLDYFGLLSLQSVAAGKVDVSLRNPGVAKSNSQLTKQIDGLRLQALARVEALGLNVGPQLEAARVTLDTLEPALAEFG